MRLKNFFGLSFLVCLVGSFFSGCATVPKYQALPSYQINGSTYYPLIELCNANNIHLRYDTYTRVVDLDRDNHKINLRVGDTLVLVDGRREYLQHPIDMYQGAIVVPLKFKEKVIDVLFRAPQETPKRAFLLNSKIKKVVVDAGHGGTDPGTIGRSGLREKDVNLDIAKRLGSLLRAAGVEVVFSRSQDTFISLSQRVEIANNSNADLFISIHANANRVRHLNGFEVYYVASSVSDSKRAYQAARSVALNLEPSCLASHSLDLKATLWDMIYTSCRAESVELAQAICRSMNDNLDAKILGVKGGRYEVLRGPRMPAVLIEAGFLSNKDEERKLKNGFYRQKVAEAIFEGIKDFSTDFTIVEAVKR
jgi:N-acetylmuramoyl-L-alanine amidase